MESIKSGKAIIEQNIYETDRRWLFCPNCDAYLVQYTIKENDKPLSFHVPCHKCGQNVLVEI